MRTIFFISILFLSCNLHSQKAETQKFADSLITILNKASDSKEKINLCFELTECYFPDEVEKMKLYSSKLYSLSKKENFSTGLGLYHISQSNINYVEREKKLAKVNAQKALDLLGNTKEIQNYLKAVICMGRCHLVEADVSSLVTLFDANYKMFQKQGNTRLLGDYYLIYGSIFKSNFDKREILYLRKALNYYSLLNYKEGQSRVYYAIASSYKRMRSNVESLKFLNLAIAQNPSNFLKHLIDSERAKIYVKLGRYTEAQTLTSQVQHYMLTANQKKSDLFWMNQLTSARCDIGLKRFKKAIQKCEQILIQDIRKVYRVNALTNIGICYYELGQYEKAKSYIDKSLQLMNVENGVTGNLAIEDCFKAKVNIEGALGNYKSAWLYNQQYIEYINKTSAKIESQQYRMYQIEFNLAEKDNQIKKLKIDRLQNNLLVQKQRNFLLLSAIVLLFSVIALLIFIKFYRIVKKKNKTIFESVTKLEKLLKEKELLLKEIHHRVKNNFQLVTSLLRIQAREMDFKDINDFIEKGQTRILSMALIHENLYQTDALDKINFHEYIENLVDNIKSTFHNDNDKIITKVTAVNSNFDIQTAIPLGLIINELYSNILKHAFPNNEGTIIIEMTKKDDKEYQLIVWDDGIGMNDNKNKKNKKSIGLELVHMLVEQLNGKIDLSYDNGTKYSINFREVAG